MVTKISIFPQTTKDLRGKCRSRRINAVPEHRGVSPMSSLRSLLIVYLPFKASSVFLKNSSKVSTSPKSSILLMGNISLTSISRLSFILIFVVNCLLFFTKINHHTAQTLKKIKITSYEVYLRNTLYLCGQVT